MVKNFSLLFLIIFGFICTFTGIAQATTAVAPHWQKSPIDVYIPQNSRKTSMQHAFERWQSKSYGKLKFNFVNNGPADIDVVFTDKVDGSDTPIASYKVTIQGQEIIKAEIQIASQGEAIKKYSNDYVFTTMLHEVGHALGLSDTNRKQSSIMYMPLDEKQELMKIDMMKLYNLNNWSYLDRRSNTP